MVGVRVLDTTNEILEKLDHGKLKQQSPPSSREVEEEEQQSDEFESEDCEVEEEEEEEEQGSPDDAEDAQPIGDVIRVSNDSSGRKRNHFQSFFYDVFTFHLEDPVLVSPEEGKIKPSVALIKDIFQTEGDVLVVLGQRFFRPEEAKKKGGGNWDSHDARELFYSTKMDEIEAFNIMHKCVIHMVLRGSPIPDRKQDPGFIVWKVYDVARQKLRYLLEDDCKGVSPVARVA